MDKTASDLSSSRRSMNICARTRGIGEGDGPKYVSEFMFTFVDSGATDQIFSTSRTIW